MHEYIERKINSAFPPHQARVLIEVLKEHLPSKEDFEELVEIVQELAEAQKRTDERVQELAEAQKRTENELRALAKQFGGFTINFGLTLEDLAVKILPSYIEKYYGLKDVKLKSRFYYEIAKDEHIELNLYGQGYKGEEKVLIIGEVKTNITKKEVIKFVRILKLLEKKIRGKEVFKLFFGYTVHPSAVKVAEENSIETIATYNLIT